MDFNISVLLVITFAISIIISLVLIRPFVVDGANNSDASDLEQIKKQDNVLLKKDQEAIKKIMLDTLEDLELAKNNNELSEEEYIRQKEIIFRDASRVLK